MDKKQQLLERIKKLPAEKQAILFEQLNAMDNKNTIVPLPKGQDALASFAQEGLWNIYEIEGPNDKYNMPSAYQLSNILNVQALQNSFESVVKRHKSLRTYFKKVDNKLFQVVQDDSKFKTECIDISQLPEEQQKGKTYQLIEKNSKHIFKLEIGPLFIVSLVKISDDFHILLMNAHHIIFDGWSKGILLREVFTYYEHYTNTGKSKSLIDSLAKLDIQFGDFAEWERQQNYIDKQVDYWAEKLKDAPHLIDIGDKQRRNIPSTKGYAIPLKLTQNISKSLLEIGRKNGASAFMTILTSFSILLSRYSQQSDLLIGTPIDNRHRQELRNLIGYFLNTTVLRIQIDERKSFAEMVNLVKNICMDAYSNQEAPFNRVVETVNPIRSLSITPLFQVMFVFQVAGASEFKLPGVEIKQIDNEKIDLQELEEAKLDLCDNFKNGKFIEFESHSKYDLYLTFIEEGDDSGLSGWLTYNADLFSQSHIKSFLNDYVKTLELIVSQPDKPLYRLNSDSVISKKNPIDGLEFKTLAKCFEDQAFKLPNNIALIDGETALSFKDLNIKANRLAHYLQKYNVGMGGIVSLALDRSIDMVAAMLAVQKLGAAYLPLDPAMPAARLLSFIEDAKPVVNLSISAHSYRFDGVNSIQTIYIDIDSSEILKQSELNPNRNYLSADCIAYYLYTSGSTGQPKGVMATHKATMNRLQWMWDAYPYSDNEMLCHKTTCGFVDSVAEIWGPLLKGKPLLIIPQESVLDLFEFIGILRDNKVTRLTLVPSLLLSMLDHYPELSGELPELKMVICSGEVLQEDLARRFYETFDKALLINLYGSTEVAADVSVYEVPRQDGYDEGISIGKPINNANLYVLDQYLNHCPTSVAGELYIGGLPVSLGYANDPKLTAQKFLPNIFSDDGSRMFCTHDKVKLIYDGSFHYLGRTDKQIKIRGFRINLDEIKQTLTNHHDIKDGLVISSIAASGEPVLIAYLIPEDVVSADFKTEYIRRYLREQLPDYMVPGHYEVLPEFPLLDNGKINIHDLPEPDFAKQLGSEYIQANTETELILTELWKEILQVSKIGITDNFFDLGGHSILATKLVVMIREKYDIEIKVQDIFTYLTIQELASQIDKMISMKQIIFNNEPCMHNKEVETIEF